MKIKILYLQLPLLDNDTQTKRENFPFAGAYLDHALKRSAEAPFYETIFTPPEWDELDTAHLAQQIIAADIDIIACTLYLWNIERALHLAEALKQIKPTLKIIAGGPEVARGHPLLAQQTHFDAIVTGEGEAVFPELLSAWRTNTPINFDNVATADPTGLKWGNIAPPSVDGLPPHNRAKQPLWPASKISPLFILKAYAAVRSPAHTVATTNYTPASGCLTQKKSFNA